MSDPNNPSELRTNFQSPILDDDLAEYPRIDPMLIALPLMRVDNIAIDAEIAFQLQEIYEDIANRYLDMSILLRNYVEREERKRASTDRKKP